MKLLPLLFVLALGCEHTEPECPECPDCEKPELECDENNQCRICIDIVV